MIWILLLFAVFLIGVPISFWAGFHAPRFVAHGSALEILAQRMFTGVDNYLYRHSLVYSRGQPHGPGRHFTPHHGDFAQTVVGHMAGGLGMWLFWPP